MEDLYDITYIQKQAFIVHMKDRDLVFYQREKLNIADWNDMVMVATTVHEGEQLHSSEEVCKAKLVHEFIWNSGYPSAKEAVHLLTDGNMRNILLLVSADTKQAYETYGVHPEYAKGQLVKGTAHRMPVDNT